MKDNIEKTVTIAMVEQEISIYLNKIGKMFKNPKITLIVRSPDIENGDMMLSNDDLNEAINSLEEFREKELANLK